LPAELKVTAQLPEPFDKCERTGSNLPPVMVTVPVGVVVLVTVTLTVTACPTMDGSGEAGVIVVTVTPGNTTVCSLVIIARKMLAVAHVCGGQQFVARSEDGVGVATVRTLTRVIDGAIVSAPLTSTVPVANPPGAGHADGIIYRLVSDRRDQGEVL
jgi:hypothetical protein